MIDRRRTRFLIALAAFAAWVAALGYRAATSSQPPQPRMTAGGDVSR
jgi:hypothetical protein